MTTRPRPTTYDPHGRPLRRAAARLHAQEGFTLVEILISMALVSIGVAATIGIFGSSNRATVSAQRGEVGVQQAQAEIDRLSTLEYGEMAMTSTPSSSTDPKDPRNRVSGANFQVRSGLSEPFVTTPGTGDTAQVNAGPDPFSVGSGDAAVTGKLYRFVTWRDEQCPASLCDGNENTKRVTVAITLDPKTSTDPIKAPIWLSTIMADPDAVPPGREAPEDEDDGSDTSAQAFYLYDTPCGQTARQTPSGDHATHNTASISPSPDNNSTCSNGTVSKQPDLMGINPPPNASAPVYKYSSDLGGSYPGGLALMKHGTTCKTSYSASTDPTAANLYNIHAWATNAFSTDYVLSGRVTVSFFTATLGAFPGRGVLCATLIDRQVFSGLPSDRVLGSAVYDVANWPTDIRRLTFTFNLAQEETLAAGHRLVLALHLRGESTNDVALLYDHALYPSLLEIETSTPM